MDLFIASLLQDEY
jgi:hypothetical protein